MCRFVRSFLALDGCIDTDHECAVALEGCINVDHDRAVALEDILDAVESRPVLSVGPAH